ncbi:hypothetical protein [Chryseobacterium sp. KCF3-3]|uniref:hypothetical protein n=1 Tax=Chryseobacterium sp. KCF3-3 TaxID=3231511 RepID=UPI0038B2E3DF
MVVSLKNSNKIFYILFCIIFFQFVKSQTNQKDFYRNLDSYIENKKDYKFLLISLSKKCGNEYLFNVSPRSFNSINGKKYYSYTYKGLPIIYEINSKNTTLKINSFFKKYLKKGKFNVNSLPKSSEDDAFIDAMYFKEDKYISNENEVRVFMEKKCCTDSKQ